MRILTTFRLSVVIALSLPLMPVSTAQYNPAPGPTVITHVTVVNPGTSSVQRNQTVVVTGDRITSVSDAEKFQVPKNARVIDATGQYLIPGLWDMHVHSAFGDWFPGGRDIILPLFIANGVTGVRDMGGDIPVLSTRIYRMGNCASLVLSLSALPPVSLLPWTRSKRKASTSSRFSPSFRAMHISPPPRKPTNKACRLSAMCPIRFASGRLSRRDKRVSSI
jgi:hypothetical protein